MPRAPKPTTPSPAGPEVTTPAALRVFDAIFRFLASLKLAVISLTTLAAVLGYATFYERSYGTAAVAQNIYRSPGFAILLAFLGANILCAALIRFPWKARQTGFVITHGGLLVVLLASFLSFKVCDEGQLGMVEGQTSGEMVRPDTSVIRVMPIDPETGRETLKVSLPFHPGTFPWDVKEAALRAAQTPRILGLPLVPNAAFLAGVAGLASAVVLLVALLVFGPGLEPSRRAAIRTAAAGAGLVAVLAAAAYVANPPELIRRDVLTDGRDPFRLVVKDYLPASSLPRLDPVEAEDGVPMLGVSLLVRPPGSDEAMDAFAGDPTDRSRWLIAENPRLRRDTTEAGPARVAFQYIGEDADALDDFLHPPKDPLKQDQARIHYDDAAGKPRVYEWILDEDQVGETVSLPDSDLEVTFTGFQPQETGGHLDSLGPVLYLAIFQVRKGDGDPVTHFGWANVPTAPNVMPNPEAPDAEPLVRIGYFHPPAISNAPMMGGTAGLIEVMGTADGTLYYRAFNRQGMTGPETIRPRQPVNAFGGDGRGMSVTFLVDRYLTSGVEREVCDPVVLPPGQKGNGVPAALVELTADGQTRATWVRRNNHPIRPRYETIALPDGRAYRVALDFERRDLGMELALEDFQVGMDPGTAQASSFTSRVLFSDPRRGVVKEPATITMNEPLQYQSWTYYQANYLPEFDAAGNETGAFTSVFQVRYDPVWPLMYFGCFLVFVGTFVQFYMRAGIFTDGGKKGRERAEARALRRARKAGRPAPTPAEEPVEIEAL